MTGDGIIPPRPFGALPLSQGENFICHPQLICYPQLICHPQLCDITRNFRLFSIFRYSTICGVLRMVGRVILNAPQSTARLWCGGEKSAVPRKGSIKATRRSREILVIF